MDEAVGAGAARGLHRRRLARLGPSIEDVVEGGAVEHRGFLRDHRDLAPQPLLREVADVDPVQRHAPRLHIVQPQQQVHEGRLAGAGAADQPDLLARRNDEREVAHAAGPLSVLKVRRLEGDAAAGGLRGRRAGAVGDGVGRGEGAHPVLDHADVGEDVERGPGDPAAHIGRPEHQRGGRRHLADADVARPPAPERDRNKPGAAERVEDRQPRAHRQGHAAELDRPFAKARQPLARVILLAARMGEELDGRDIGEAVDEAAIDLGARLGAGLGGATDRTKRDRHQPDVKRDPPRAGERHRPVDRPQHPQHADEIDHQHPHRVDRVEREAHERAAGLHLLGDKPPGEIVLEESQRLAERVAVQPPENKRDEPRPDRQPRQRRLREIRERPGDAEQEQREQQHRPVIGEQPLRPALAARSTSRPMNQFAHTSRTAKLTVAAIIASNGQRASRKAQRRKAPSEAGGRARS